MSHINDDLKDLMADPNKYESTPRNEMARIFRIFLREHRINASTFQRKLLNWNGGANASSWANQNNNNKPNARGNFVKAITKDRISFDRFFEFMCIAAPLSWSITIGVRWGVGREQGLRFNYIPDPEKYKKLTGEQLPPHTVPIIDHNAPDPYTREEITVEEEGIANFMGTKDHGY